MKKISYKFIKDLYKKYGYPFYTKPYDLNLMAFRNPDLINNNIYNDLEVVAYVDDIGTEFVHIFPCTTEPGLTSLLHPVNPKGAAIIKPGFYRSLWQLGYHKGKPALVQINPITLYRDNDRDSVAEPSGPTESSIAGINNHMAREDRVVKFVNDFSAGCVATPNCSHLRSIISSVRKQMNHGLGDKVSFALFSEPIVFDEEVPCL